MKEPLIVQDSRLQHLPELRELIDELLAKLQAYIELDQNAVLAAHVVRTSPRSFEERAFRERFLHHLPLDQVDGAREFGSFLCQLLFCASEHYRLPDLKEDVESLIAEIRHAEGYCVLIDDADVANTPSEERLKDLVAASGALLGALGDLLERTLGKRRPRVPTFAAGGGREQPRD